MIEDSGGPRNHVLDGGTDSPWEEAILRGVGRPIAKYRDTLWSAKTAGPIQILFGLSARMSPLNHELDGVHL